jgi:hypothetical protein
MASAGDEWREGEAEGWPPGRGGGWCWFLGAVASVHGRRTGAPAVAAARWVGVQGKGGGHGDARSCSLPMRCLGGEE